MELRGVVVLLLTILGFFAAPAESVFGSQEVDIINYPHYASISEHTNVKPRFFANGAIVSKTCVVTTASIVKGYRPHELVVRVGSSKADSEGEQVNVAQVALHPNPDAYDIAFLKLSSPITSQNVRPIGFGARPAANEVAYVSSLGQSEAGYSAPKLRHARMKVLPVCECARADQGLFSLTNAPENGTCDRDDGAPVVYKGYLAGLASGKRFACRDQRKEGAFVDISEKVIQDFIRGCL